MLSQAEIVDHYNNGAGKYYASASKAPAVAQAPEGCFKPVSYRLPTTSSLGSVESPLQQTTTLASFEYDGDGRQVKAVVGSTTTYYPLPGSGRRTGAHYQIDELLRTKRKEIIEIAQKHGAYDLHVFGSLARGEWNEQSDKERVLEEALPGCSAKTHAGNSI